MSIDTSTDNFFPQDTAGRVVPIKISGKPLDDAQTMMGILRTVAEFQAAAMRCVVVHGGGKQVTDLLGPLKDTQHSRTKLRITPPSQVPAIVRLSTELQQRIADQCRQVGLEPQLMSASVIEATRLPGHGATGDVDGVRTYAIQEAITKGKVPIIPFGGLDHTGTWLNTNADTSAAAVAAELKAIKLFLLTNERGILVPNGNGQMKLLSYVDFKGLLALLRLLDKNNKFVVDDGMLPKLEAAALAVAQGVDAVHIIKADGLSLREEMVSDVGTGTIIERMQRHRIAVGAHASELPDIKRIRAECMTGDFTAKKGTTFLKPKTDAELTTLLDRTLVFHHRDRLIGTMYFEPVDTHPATVSFGGFAVSHRNQGAQHGRQLCETCLETLGDNGFLTAISITASPVVKNLYKSLGGISDTEGKFGDILSAAAKRYQAEERGDVELFVFNLHQPVSVEDA
ncbi:MAG: hypothetical protein PHZ00_01540 [Candidatus Peribacteraceae bacterium]|nr:hypothetical protein [Candidatus Peribacteraceae bacterium]